MLCFEIDNATHNIKWLIIIHHFPLFNSLFNSKVLFLGFRKSCMKYKKVPPPMILMINFCILLCMRFYKGKLLPINGSCCPSPQTYSNENIRIFCNILRNILYVIFCLIKTIITNEMLQMILNVLVLSSFLWKLVGIFFFIFQLKRFFLKSKGT